MKLLLNALILTVSISTFAQKAPPKEEIKEFFWGKDDQFAKVNSVPDSYKKESAVIIYKYDYYDYHKFGSFVKYVSAIRKRIKLQDQAAVKEFSEFSFKDRFATDKGNYIGTSSNTIGIKIVKPDGKEYEIDVEKESKAVDKEKKIAISNLEVGDIIDFYGYRFEPFQSKLEFGFEPVETTLGETYPIMDYKLNFRTENDFFINFNSYNGAPELTEIPSTKSNDRHYELTAKAIPKNDFPVWFYPLVELPCYKFQVYFARSGKFEERAQAFLSEKEKIIKKTVSKEDIFNYYNDKFRPFGDLGYIEKFLKGKKFNSDEEKVREVYYFTRHNYLTQYVEAFVIKEANIFYPFALYKNPIFFSREVEFIDHFMAFLKDNKIDYDIVIATPRDNGPIEDLLIQKNLDVLLRVNTPNPVYLQFFTPYTSADQINSKIENSNAYVLNVAKRKRVTDVSLEKLPSSTAADNKSKIVSNVSLDKSMTGMVIDRESSYFGHLKDEEQKDKLYYFDYVNEDYIKYGTKPLLERVSNKKDREKYTREYDALGNKSREKQKAEFKKAADDDLDVPVTNFNYTVKNAGRFGRENPMMVTEQFTLENSFVKKAGANYLVEIGKVIGGQIQIDNKKKERTNNIYFGFPRTLENQIIFEIPSGYTVSGIEKLNKNIKNSTGGFVSTAKIDGNKLIIDVAKTYNTYYEPNANWPRLIDFLDAAYQFSQEKILLKKA